MKPVSMAQIRTLARKARREASTPAEEALGEAVELLFETVLDQQTEIARLTVRAERSKYGL